MKPTTYSIDPEGGILGVKSPSLWAYDEKGRGKPVCYFLKPRWMKKKDFQRVLERIKLDICQGEKLF